MEEDQKVCTTSCPDKTFEDASGVKKCVKKDSCAHYVLEAAPDSDLGDLYARCYPLCPPSHPIVDGPECKLPCPNGGYWDADKCANSCTSRTFRMVEKARICVADCGDDRYYKTRQANGIDHKECLSTCPSDASFHETDGLCVEKC